MHNIATGTVIATYEKRIAQIKYDSERKRFDARLMVFSLITGIATLISFIWLVYSTKNNMSRLISYSPLCAASVMFIAVIIWIAISKLKLFWLHGKMKAVS